MARGFSFFFPLLVVACALLVAVAGTARAETIEAPVGGRPIALGDARVACVANAGGWRAEPGGHAVRPPTSDAAIGATAELRVAPTAADCPRATSSVKLVATATWPNFDLSSFTLAIDEGRLEAQGSRLHGVVVTWPSDTGRASDSCRDLKVDGGVETCAWGVPKTLSVDPTASALRWLPAGSQVGPDVSLYDAEGRAAAPDGFAIVPSRVEVMDILPADASVDVSSGVGRAPLSHPEAVAGVDCGTARCSADAGVLVMQAPPAAATSVDVKFRLAPHVTYTRRSPPETQPVIKVAIVRCPMGVVSGPALRGLDTARVVVRIEGACAHDLASLRFFVGGRATDMTTSESAKDAAFAVLNLGSIDTPTVSITAVRGEGEGAVVAVARIETRPPPVVRTVLEIAGFPPIDFIPNNRPATVLFPRVPDGELALLSIDDVYEAKRDGAITTVQGDMNAVGLVALRFGYRAPNLPAPLDKVDLGILTDSLQRSIKEANVPAPLALAAFTPAPLVDVVCSKTAHEEVRPIPGIPAHLPYEMRDGCRVVFHRERLLPEYGTQRIQFEIEVDKLDGSSRPEGKVTQTLIMRAGNEPRVAWIKGVSAPYDRVVVRISHQADEQHYLGASDIVTGAPALQWSMVFGTGRVRLYATTAIPTGLYRFGNSTGSGVLSLSLAVITRLTWLDTDGHEGLLGLEGGIMAFGFTNADSQSLTEVGVIAGVGLSIPIAGAGSATQASINLHAWFEQRVTTPAAAGTETTTEANGSTMTTPLPKSSAQGFIVGPSISFGNIGTTF